jgi:hypothetical protein
MFAALDVKPVLVRRVFQCLGLFKLPHSFSQSSAGNELVDAGDGVGPRLLVLWVVVGSLNM